MVTQSYPQNLSVNRKCELCNSSQPLEEMDNEVIAFLMHLFGTYKWQGCVQLYVCAYVYVCFHLGFFSPEVDQSDET